MRLKVVQNDVLNKEVRWPGYEVFNAETGERLERVVSVEFRAHVDRFPTLVIELLPGNVEIEAEGQVIEDAPTGASAIFSRDRGDTRS